MADFGLRKETGEWVVGVDIAKSTLITTGDPYNTAIVFLNLVQAQKCLYSDFPKKQVKTKWLEDFVIADREQLNKDRIAFIKQQALADQLLNKNNQAQVENVPEVSDNKHSGQHFEVGCPSCE